MEFNYDKYPEGISYPLSFLDQDEQFGIEDIIVKSKEVVGMSCM